MRNFYFRVSIVSTGDTNGTTVYDGAVEPYRLQQRGDFSGDSTVTPGEDAPTDIDVSRARVRGYLRWKSILEKLSENYVIAELRNIKTYMRFSSIGVPADDYDYVTDTNTLLNDDLEIGDTFVITVGDETPIDVEITDAGEGTATPISVANDINEALDGLGYAIVGPNNEIIIDLPSGVEIEITDDSGDATVALGLNVDFEEHVDHSPSRVDFVVGYDQRLDDINQIITIAKTGETSPGSVLSGINAIKRMVARALFAQHTWNEFVYDSVDTQMGAGTQPVGFVVENVVADSEDDDTLGDQEAKVTVEEIDFSP